MVWQAIDNTFFHDFYQPSNPDSDHGYLYRKTAVDMLDPWDFLDLDSVESSRRTIPRYRGAQK